MSGPIGGNRGGAAPLATAHAHMRLAIERAMAGVSAGQTPFGACIVRDGEVIVCEHNVVGATTDITAHAEVHAIRQACRKLGRLSLAGCEIFSTCEPCPMCFTACHWARIDRIWFGATISDAKRYGFNELEITNETLRALGNSGIEIVPGLLRDECIDVFEAYHIRSDKLVY